MNVSFRHFYALVRAAYVSDRELSPTVLWPCSVFGAASLGGRALGFHVMLQSGAVYWRVPVHALAWTVTAEPLPLAVVQRWDCFGDDCEVTIFDHLEELECDVRGGDGVTRGAAYVMTFDWLRNGYSLTPDQHKCLHLVRLDGGQFALHPNTDILWREPSFTTDEANAQLSTLRVNRYVYRAEARLTEVAGA